MAEKANVLALRNESLSALNMHRTRAVTTFKLWPRQVQDCGELPVRILLVNLGEANEQLIIPHSFYDASKALLDLEGFWGDRGVVLSEERIFA
jgi:hypothetical protein